MMKKINWDIIKKILIGITLLIVVLIAVFFFWTMMDYGASEQTVEFIKNNKNRIIEKDDYFLIKPNASKYNDEGMIFYPGGKVESAAYVKIGYELSKLGYIVIIAKMPFKLSFLDWDFVDSIKQQFIGTTTWNLIGHSLGGAMACKYVYENPGSIKSLILLASYPANNNSLRDRDIKVLSIVGEFDGLVSETKIKSTKKYLPDDTIYKVVKGGNHSLFGNYGLQSNDIPPRILNEVQHQKVREYIKKYIIENKVNYFK